MSQPSKALLIHNGALGDFLVASRLISICDRYFGPHRWTCLGKPSSGRLARALQLIDHSEDFSRPGWHLLFTPDSPLPPAIPPFLQSFDLIVNLICGPKAIFSTRLTSATSPTCPTLFHIEPKPPEGYADHTLQFQASQMGLSLPLLPETSYRVASDIVLAVREELALSKIDPSRLVLFHPGASSPAKRWPLDCFCDLITRTRKANRIPGVLLGEVELEQFSSKDISRLKSLAHPFFDWPLENIAALLSLAHRYIGNDNGISHLSGSVGTATDVIFIKNNSQNWRPIGPHVRIFSPDAAASLLL